MVTKTDSKKAITEAVETPVVGSPKSGPAPEAAAMGGKNGHSPEAPGPEEFEIDLSHWTTKHLMSWQRLAGVGVLVNLIEMAMPTVRKWPYAGDPMDMEAWEVLPPSHAWAVCKAVGSEVSNFFR